MHVCADEVTAMVGSLPVLVLALRWLRTRTRSLLRWRCG
jgi:hypothetical protein